MALVVERRHPLLVMMGAVGLLADICREVDDVCLSLNDAMGAEMGPAAL